MAAAMPPAKCPAATISKPTPKTPCRLPSSFRHATTFYGFRPRSQAPCPFPLPPYTSHP